MIAAGCIIFNAEEVRRYYSARVPKLAQTGTEWRGPCPIHHGKDDNFAVEPSSGRWFCHSRCGHGGDILELEEALNGGDFPTRKSEVCRLLSRIEPEYRAAGSCTNGNAAENAPTKPTEPSGAAGEWRELDRYPYVDRDGSLLYEVVRYRKPDGHKAFHQCRPGGPRGTIWNLRGIKHVPYRLPKLLNAQGVYLPEGEKDVHTLEGWGLVASCNPGGSGANHLYAEWLTYFQGRHVVILPDNDEPGRRHAIKVAEILLPATASLRIVELPGLPPKGDVTDWQEAGNTLERFRELTAASAALDAAALSEWRRHWNLQAPDSRPPTVEARTADAWPKPEPIQSELPSVDPFSKDLLPDTFRSLVTDISERMQVPMDYPAVVIVLCLAGAVNRRALIQPKANDSGWLVVPNLWGGIVAPPGYMKSPVIQAGTCLLHQIQTDWRHEHEEALKDFVREQEEFELRRAAWKEQYKANAKKGKAVPDRPEDEPKKPTLRRLIVNDATFEALHQMMSENSAGILVIRDELTGWWSQMDRAGREGERAFCMQAWNGDTGHTIDRIGRGTIHVEACCMSMLGGIQPGRLRSYLADALEDGPGNDGLIQRFQLLVWPDTTPDWSYVDRATDPALAEGAARLFRKLLELDAGNPVKCRFAPDAQELFIEWLAELEAKIRGNELHHALISHLSKYRSLMPTLALLFHLTDVAAGKGDLGIVSVEQTRKAAAWCEYLESHAKRVYSCIVSPQVRRARELADKIQKRKLGADSIFSCRDVYLKGWSGLDTPEAVKQAAEVLQDAGWLREVLSESGPLGGRPSNRYIVNPAVWE